MLLDIIVDLHQVEASLSLPDTHNTVAVRAGLAQEYVRASREQARLCEGQILDQHLQHQGWAAALANLEDSVTALQKRQQRFQETYQAYLGRREHYREVIDTFDEDLHVLSKIPVLPALLEPAEQDSGVEGSQGEQGSRPASAGLAGRSGGGAAGPGAGNTKTLLDWISRAGNHSLEQVGNSILNLIFCIGLNTTALCTACSGGGQLLPLTRTVGPGIGSLYAMYITALDCGGAAGPD